MQALDIRLSYNDVQLFLAIAKSIPQQTGAALPDSAASGAGNAADPSSSALGSETSLAHETRDGSKHVLDPVLGMFFTVGVKPFFISKEGFYKGRLIYMLNTKDVGIFMV